MATHAWIYIDMEAGRQCFPSPAEVFSTSCLFITNTVWQDMYTQYTHVAKGHVSSLSISFSKSFKKPPKQSQSLSKSQGLSKSLKVSQSLSKSGFIDTFFGVLEVTGRVLQECRKMCGMKTANLCLSIFWICKLVRLAVMPKRKRPGGIKQRLAAAARGANDYKGQSALANLLISLFAWGDFSPQRVQTIAELAVRDFENAQDNEDVLNDLHVLAKIGTRGQHSNKCHSDLMGKVQHVSKIPNPFFLRISFKPPFAEALQAILLPHELFSCIYRCYQKIWTTRIYPGEATCRKFWRSVRQHPFFTDSGSPLTRRPDFETKCIPLAVHGDGVPITGIGKGWTKTATMWSWYSLIGSGLTGSMLFYIWMMFDALRDGTLSEGTLEEYFALLRWSLLILYEGTWPSKDHRGKLHLIFTQIDFILSEICMPNIILLFFEGLHSDCFSFHEHFTKSQTKVPPRIARTATGRLMAGRWILLRSFRLNRRLRLLPLYF